MKAYHHWFKNVQLKMSIAASNSNSNMIPHDLGCNHSHCFTLSRVHLSFEKTVQNLIKYAHGFPYHLRLFLFLYQRNKCNIIK